MDSKEFKKLFSSIAKINGFKSAYSCWFKESAESVVVLDLQKSNFGDYYEMNIKIFIQGMFGNNYIISKKLVKGDVGNIFRRQPKEYKTLFDFDYPMGEDERKVSLAKLFSDFIIPFTNNALSKSGIKKLADKGEITILPAVKVELSLI